MPDDVEYVGIPKVRLESNWHDLLPNKNVKLHGLGVIPKMMSMLKEKDFFSCDATVNSFGWSQHRIEDFYKALDETKLRMSEK